MAFSTVVYIKKETGHAKATLQNIKHLANKFWNSLSENVGGTKVLQLGMHFIDMGFAMW